jgi:hypothetical protein
MQNEDAKGKETPQRKAKNSNAIKKIGRIILNRLVEYNLPSG